MERYKVEIEFNKQDVILAARVLMLYGYDVNYVQYPQQPPIVEVYFQNLMSENEWNHSFKELETLVSRYGFTSILTLVDR